MNSKKIKSGKSLPTKKLQKFAPSASRELQIYDNKWKEIFPAKFNKPWKTDLIQKVLKRTAIRIAMSAGAKAVNSVHIKKAISDWHEEGQMNDCIFAGINIMEGRTLKFMRSKAPLSKKNPAK